MSNLENTLDMVSFEPQTDNEILNLILKNTSLYVKIGIPPISTIGFGRKQSLLNLVPKPQPNNRYHFFQPMFSNKIRNFCVSSAFM